VIIAFTGHRDSGTTKACFDVLQKDALWIHGGAIGFDSQVERYAKIYGIKTKIILPDYEQFGKSAPLIRNSAILASADLLIACYDGRTYGGTFYTINLAKEAKIPVEYVKCLKLKG
jgi:hypothetical protein